MPTTTAPPVTYTVGVRVRYHGPTATRGSRIIATTPGPGDEQIRVTLSYNPALGVIDNCAIAAQAALDKTTAAFDAAHPDFAPWQRYEIATLSNVGHSEYIVHARPVSA